MGIPSTQLPPLYAIANVDALDDPFDYVRRLFAAGVHLLQLRSKSQSLEKFGALAAEVLTLRNQIASPARVVINDYPQLCLATKADGVHLGQDDIDVRHARDLLGPDALIGLSTHTLPQLRGAPATLLSYLALGPIFPSPSKSGHAEIVGLETLAQACRESPLPLVAIGGITQENVADVFGAGATSVAIISELEKADDLAQTVRSINSSCPMRCSDSD